MFFKHFRQPAGSFPSDRKILWNKNLTYLGYPT